MRAIQSARASPTILALLFALIVFLVYLMLARPQELARDVEIQDNLAFLAFGKGGLKVINISNLTAPFEVGSYDTLGSANGIVLDGDRLFVADGDEGLLILDVADPADIQAISFFDTPGYAEDVTVDGKFAYIADARAGLQILNIEEPEAPKFPPDYTPYQPRARLMRVVVQGQRAYLADNRRRLWIADIGTESAPSQVGVFDARDTVRDLVVQGERAYLAADERGLVFVNLENPEAPEEIDNLDTPGNAQGVTVEGPFAYLADGRDGLQIVDITRPSELTRVGRYEGDLYQATDLVVRDNTLFVADLYDGLRIVDATVLVEPKLVSPETQPGNAEDVALQAGFAFLASESRGVRVLDVSQPGNPYEVELYDTTGQAYGIAVAGDHVYVADGGEGLQILSIASREPQDFRLEPAGRQGLDGQALDVALDAQYAYVAAGGAGLRIVSIGNPAAPEQVGVEDENVLNGQGVAVLGNHAYVADGGDGLKVVDVTDRTRPAVVGELDTGGEARAVAVQQVDRNGLRTYVYVAAGGAGLVVVDATNPREPVRLGANEEPEFAYDVTVRDRYAFVAGRNDGVWVIDIGDPANPVEVGFFETPGEAHAVALEENRLYVAAFDRGLQVLDIADPGNPVRIGLYEVPGIVTGVVVGDELAYIIDEGSGLRVMQVENPQNPREIGFYDSPEPASGVALGDGYAFTGVGNSLRIINISEPEDPVEVGRVDTPGRVTAVDAAGGYAYAALQQGSLQVIDISNPEEPAIIGAYDTPGEGLDIDVQGDYVFIADGVGGLQIINVINRSAPVRSSVVGGCGEAHGVLAIDDNVYVAAGGQGLCVVDVSRPPTPEIISVLGLPGASVDLAAEGSYLFVAGDEGFQVINILNPNQPVQVGAYTHPIGYLEIEVEPRPSQGDNPQSFTIYTAGGTLGLQVLQAEKSLAPEEFGLYESPGIFPLSRLFNEFLQIGFALLLDQPVNFQSKTWWTLLVMTFDSILFLAAATIWISLAAQVILPVERIPERLLAIRRLFAYLFGLIGPAVFVREGSVYHGPMPFAALDARKGGPGPSVVMVDASSAAILERHPRRYPLLLTLILEMLGRARDRLLGRPAEARKDPAPRVRVIGPGLTFTNYRAFPSHPRYSERLRSVADLRPQIRIRPEVQGYTRDGIEVATNVWIIFTLGQAPETLWVTYQGDSEPENLRVVVLEERIQSKDNGGWSKEKVVKDLSDELDPEDKEEIHRFVRGYILRGEAPASPLDQPEPKGNGPYLFDPERVHAAIYTQAQDVQEDEVMPWTELPVHAAAEVFRKVITENTYDALYFPTHPVDFPLARLKKKFAYQVRNLGVLAFRFVEWHDGRPIETGQVWDEAALVFFPTQEFRNPKVLRARGIKVITAGFSELVPDPEVRARLLESWGARWEQEAEVVLAKHDRWAIGIRKRAREEAEEKLARILAQILSMSDYSDEALALRVFQALEAAATDPATRKLLPAETLDMLRAMRFTLMP